MSPVQSIRNEDIPTGWSNNRLALEKLIRPQDLSELTDNKIQKPVGLLVKDGEDILLFRDGDEYYIWDPVSSVLDCVLSPKDTSSILHRLGGKDGHYALERTAVELAE